MVETQLTCALCLNHVHQQGPLHRLDNEEMVFCCKGCLVVYQILKVQNALEGFKDHPVYRQALQAGLITNPHLLFDKNEENKIPEEDFHRLHLLIQNLWCPSCAQIIHLILMREKGVRKCVVDYSTDLASIEYTPRVIAKEKIFRLIEQLGYLPQTLQDPRQREVSRSLLLRFIVAAFFSLNVMMFAYPIYATYFDQDDGQHYAYLFALLSLGASIPVLTYSSWPIWQRCYHGLKVGVWGMEALVCLGILTGTGLSLYELVRGSPYVYFDSMTVIILFVLLGKIIESKAKFSAKDALVKLSMALPRKGRKRLSDGLEKFVAIKEIAPDDCLIVRMGEKIVLDGIVEEGGGAVNESLMTGEAIPVSKQKGSSVLAGTILQQGYLVVKVTSSIEETALHRILDMVSHDIGHKSKVVRAADQIVRWFVPFVIAFSVLTGLMTYFWEVNQRNETSIQEALVRLISVLLISCPCAIGIAAPLAEAYLLNALAKMGMLVRNRGCLAFLGKETLFVFDKTGTLTEGKFHVCEGLKLLSFDQQRVLKGLVFYSMHPIAVALNEALLCPPYLIEGFEERVGKGISGIYQGEKYFLGSETFLEQMNIPFQKLNKGELDLPILTTVYFAKESHSLSRIILGDQLRSGVKEFINQLFPIKTVLLSGDGEPPVSAVAKVCGISEWHWRCLPTQKKVVIDAFKAKCEVVAMLGDGINDAPALTSAHVGIAVVSASDISIQVSDILLTSNNFESLSQLRQIAMKGRRIVKQNLFWAFFYNVIGLGVAAVGLMTPLFAAFAMVMSSLIVLLNAQRLHVKDKK